MRRRAPLGVSTSILLLLFAAFSAHAADVKKDPTEIGGRNVSKGVNLYSLDREVALGKQLALEVEKQAKIVDDPIVSEYLNRLGQDLVRHSDVTFPVSFKMIDSEEINAFTLPGGFVFINSGVLKLSDNEAELASVIAHELGHAAARHATRQATREQMINLSAIPLSVMGGIAGLAVRQVATTLAAPMTLFHFSRAFETEADLLGIQYLWNSGYDPGASVDMFERVESMERKKPGSVSKLFRTHPQTEDRIVKTQRDIEQLLPQRAEYTVNTSEYEDVRTRLYELTKPKVAEKESNVPTLRRKYGNDLE